MGAVLLKMRSHHRRGRGEQKLDRQAQGRCHDFVGGGCSASQVGRIDSRVEASVTDWVESSASSGQGKASYSFQYGKSFAVIVDDRGREFGLPSLQSARRWRRRDPSGEGETSPSRDTSTHHWKQKRRSGRSLRLSRGHPTQPPTQISAEMSEMTNNPRIVA
ncbi:hypothetical protein CDL15_Pgr016906 [Punica granatum]|uniref:Uncharacterized protein n=1 Tax=Punica granatum TaxID=22663 RepID=A0A218WY61_PUNGR|nr:hypothetical protein CDL15_Pgr016906 [Punica granatum]PKI77567.1 hypothetical protein CRG98_002021 [Punica granatum]